MMVTVSTLSLYVILDSLWKQTFQTNLMNESFLMYWFLWRWQECPATESPWLLCIVTTCLAQCTSSDKSPSLKTEIGRTMERRIYEPVCFNCVPIWTMFPYKNWHDTSSQCLEKSWKCLEKVPLAWGPLIQARPMSGPSPRSSVRNPWTQFGSPAFDLSRVHWWEPYILQARTLKRASEEIHVPQRWLISG